MPWFTKIEIRIYSLMVDPFVVIRLKLQRHLLWLLLLIFGKCPFIVPTIIPSNSGHNSHTRRKWSWWREGHAWGSPWVPYKSPASLRTCGGESKRGFRSKGRTCDLRLPHGWCPRHECDLTYSRPWELQRILYSTVSSPFNSYKRYSLVLFSLFFRNILTVFFVTTTTT